MKLFTIGFTQKRAETFFDLLNRAEVKTLIDIRLKPDSQLSGFAKRNDLAFFIPNLVPGCTYRHLPELAPSEMVLDRYRVSKSWSTYEVEFLQLMTERRIPETLDPQSFENGCLLCSEAMPEHCHRRLVSELIQQKWGDFQIIHL